MTRPDVSSLYVNNSVASKIWEIVGNRTVDPGSYPSIMGMVNPCISICCPGGDLDRSSWREMGIVGNTLLFVKKGTVEGGVCGIGLEADAADADVADECVAVVFNGVIGTLSTGDDGWRLLMDSSKELIRLVLR